MTETTAIVKAEEGVTLEVYGGRPEIREMSDRLMLMLPQVKKLGKPGAMALAQVSLAMGLNPFIGEIWAIPQDKNGATFAIMPGIKGLRRKAREWCERHSARYHVYLRTAREDEIEGLRVNGGDIVRACDLTIIDQFALELLKATGQQMVYTGIGVYRNGEPTKMNPLQVARKRAEADAIKQAFDVPAPVLSSGVTSDASLVDEYGILDEMPSVPEVYLEDHISDNGNAVDAIADVFGDVAAYEYDDEPETDYPDGEGLPLPVEEAPHVWTPEEAKEFALWYRNEIVITDAEALDMLGVDKISAFLGDIDEAKKLINAQVALEAAHAEALEEEPAGE